MRTRLRILADSYTVVSHLAKEQGFGTTGSRALAHVDAEGDRREYLVSLPPFGASGSGMPVYFHARTDARQRPRRQQSLLLTDPPDAPPYVLIDTDFVDSPRARIVHGDARVEEVDEVVLVGSGMRSVTRDFPSGHTPTAAELRRGRWSRTIGGLRGNFGALRRLQSADYALVGCGRNGALLASHLAALGVFGRLTLIDDDVVEDHNADAMGLDPGSWRNVRKVDAVAHLVRAQNRRVELARVARSASHPDAIAAMARSDLILSAVDHGEARVVVAQAGAAFLRPVLDVGSGIGVSERGAWRGGCDVRLTLPGRCLVCFGGVQQADRPRVVDWWTQRAGSLRSLNAVATGIGQWMLERLFSARRFDSSWVRVVARDDGGFETETIHDVPDVRSCPVCTRTSMGWDAFGVVTG